MSFFHGARVKDAPSTGTPIQSVNASVFGLLCTADNSAPAASASLAIGGAATNNGLTFTAVNPGANGNLITVAVVNPNAANALLAVTVNNQAIIVSLACDATGAPESTGATVLAAIEANEQATALVTVAATGASSGAGIVTATPTLNLTGGADEAFPLNTPVLCPGDPVQAAQLGTAGTGLTALTSIFQQIGALCVVVRVASSAEAATQVANLIGTVDANGHYTGAQAFLGAESITGFRPMVLLAPTFTGSQTVVAGTQTVGAEVVTGMIPVANSLRAHILVEGPNTTDAAAYQYSLNFGGQRRVFFTDPGVWTTDANGNPLGATNSAFVAGVIAATDANLGYWWSPSNQQVNGITGTTRAVDYTEADQTCRANVLNSQNITTIIRKNGYRLWGNRTLSADPQYAFLCVSRVDDIIALSIQDAVNTWAVDRPMTGNFYKDVADEVNAYLRQLKNQGVINGGNCYPNPKLNTATAMTNGQSFFNYDWSPAYPAEDIEVVSSIVTTYLPNIGATATA